MALATEKEKKDLRIASLKELESKDGEEKHVRGKVCDRESNRNQDFEEQGKGMIDIIAGDGRSRQKRLLVYVAQPSGGASTQSAFLYAAMTVLSRAVSSHQPPGILIAQSKSQSKLWPPHPHREQSNRRRQHAKQHMGLTDSDNKGKPLTRDKGTAVNGYTSPPGKKKTRMNKLPFGEGLSVSNSSGLKHCVLALSVCNKPRRRSPEDASYNMRCTRL
ncbi:hypothetical protein F2P81_002302 [Scophthalmus maximus]|uniref:Uncharacterized protein n=1 Tax=Scophthalmus maximus TaxID=52904 RepID=A0A6A4TIE9_SCOMX|nr:hypothetical protein F2P81_002302 [Scophthalmus maximus]